MAIAIQTATNAPGAAATTNVLSFPSNCTKGNTIIVGSSDNNGVLNSISGITDTLGNTYARATAATEGGFVGGEIWYATNRFDGPNTITITYIGSITTAVVIAEYPGLLVASSPFDVAVSASSTAGTALASGNTASTTQNRELVVGVGASNNAPSTTLTAGAGFGNLIQVINATTVQLCGMEDKQVDAKAVQAAAMTMSAGGHWVMCCATFRYKNTGLNNRGLRPRPFAPGLAR